MKEDDTGFFDSCEPGTPDEYAPNSGYRERKKQFAKEVAVKDAHGTITGYELS